MDTIFCRTTLHHASGRAVAPLRPVEVPIRDARAADLPGWQECGFQRVDHRSAVGGWDGDAIRARHYAEMEQLARALSGCDHALVSNHIIRGPLGGAQHSDLAPIEFVHSDFAAGHDANLRAVIADPAHEVVTASLARQGIDRAVAAAAKRIVVLQFWRNLGPPRMDLPIAFCDVRSVVPEDAVAFEIKEYGGPGGPTFDGLAILPPDDPARHRWYAYPDLRDDEVVAFRTFDSDLVAEGRVYWTPHSAFRDPSVRRGHPARSSIELRATCLFL